MKTDGNIDVPQRIVDLVRDSRDLLGIGEEWHIHGHMSDDAMYNGYEAETKVDSEYLNATIRFSTDMTDDDEIARAVVLHELLHVAHSAIDDLVFALAEHVPAPTQALFESLYKAEVERFNQRLSRALAKSIKPTR